ncbi:MAG TPA: cytochrome c peroxidase [Polyangiaceae bacterium]|nr:cytochrome c peroxidase [Polyangiaceae bacterium]
MTEPIGKRSVTALVLSLLAASCAQQDDTALLLAALKEHAAPPETSTEGGRQVAINPRLLRRFEPLRAQIEHPQNPITDDKVELGKLLYFEKRLSKHGDLSCNSCHPLGKYGADQRATSLGTDGQLGKRNAPSVYNAAGFFAQFWDGRAQTVEEQATGPILNPVEMGLPSAEAGVKLLKSIPEYVRRFQAAFPTEKDPVTFENVGRAIGAFERRLMTPSRWDEYLRGSESALTELELEGLRTFTNVGCMVCHTGEFVGGGMYQKVGVVEAWPNQSDQGRFEVTHQDVDRMMFKVPSLRNVAQTAPYFHDGSVANLEDAVRLMGKHQLGLRLSDREVTAVVAWLNALTGPLPALASSEPASPE